MNRKVQVLVAFLVLLTSAVAPVADAAEAEVQRHCEQLDKDGRCDLYGPSLVELIANAERYHGKKVRVIGYLKLEFEGQELFIHKDDYTRFITKNGVWVDIDPKTYNSRKLMYSEHYVLIEGVFDAYSQGHLGAASGTIRDISRLDYWEWAREGGLRHWLKGLFQ